MVYDYAKRVNANCTVWERTLLRIEILIEIGSAHQNIAKTQRNACAGKLIKDRINSET